MVKLSLQILFLLIFLTNCGKKSEETPSPATGSETKKTENTAPVSTSESESDKNAYVSEKSGLILRSAASKDSEKLDLIPFGTNIAVEGFQMGMGSEEIQNRLGDWLETKYNGKTGYVFSGFLSAYDPTLKINEKFICDGVMGYNVGKEGSFLTLILFENNTFIKEVAPFEGGVIGKGKFQIEKDKYSLMGEENEVYYKFSGGLVIESDRQKLIDEPNLIERLNRERIEKEEKGIYEEEGESIYVCTPLKA